MSTFTVIRAGFLALALAAAAGCATPKLESTSLADEDVARLLTGKWDLSYAEGLRRTKGFDHFMPDGRYAAEILLTVGSQDFASSVKGTWKVVDGNIVETIESSSPAIHVPGTVYRLRVIAIDADRMVTEGAGGVVSERKRIK